MKVILFSESEEFYRCLGLKNIPNVKYVFNGQRLYNKSDSYFEKYHLFVCSFYCMTHNVLLTNIFKRLNITTVLCSDGIFDFSNAIENPMQKKYDMKLYHPILQDYFLCVGDKETNYFRTFTNVLQFIPERLLNKPNVIALPEIPRILVTTANTAYFNEDEFSLLFDLISGCISYLINNKIKFDVRFYDQRLLQALVQLYPNLNNVIDGGFENIISNYSSVITTPSSIIISSMFHQRSVCQLIYRDYPTFINAGWNISSVDMFHRAFPSIIERDPIRIDIQNRIVLGYTFAPTITERLTQLLSIVSDNKKMREIYLEKSYENMLRSSFNFNVEYYMRRIYRLAKNNKFVKKIRTTIK